MLVPARFFAVSFTLLFFLVPSFVYADDLRALSDVTTGGKTIYSGAIVNRSDLINLDSTWTFHFTWGYFVPNHRAYLVVFRGTFGALEGGDLSEGVNYSASNQAWSAEEASLTKSFSIPALGNRATTAGTYTAFLADTSNAAGLLEWFASGGVSGVAPTNYSSLTFTYSALDIPENLPQAIEAVSYRGVVLHEGDELYRDSLPALAPPGDFDRYWNFTFEWPNGVSNQRALIMVFRGTFGSIEDDVPSEGVNYSGTFQQWASGENEFGKYFGLPALKSESTASSTYTFMIAERDSKYPLGDFSQEALWFSSGGTEGIAPAKYSFLTFDFKGDKPPECCSSVLFLPGIKGSRLYRATSEGEEQLWEPGLFEGNDDVRALFLDANGKSINDVYAKIGDILGTAGGNSFYQSFIHDMNALQSAGTIDDWEATAYDWRLSINDIIENGLEENGKIFFGTGTSTPYIEQTLRSLAQKSKTGKVTIVAHSNGGLVAKALLQRLDVESASLVDNVILVGVPQTGAPRTIGSLLYGYKEGIPDYFPIVVKTSVAREFAENAPMPYHLLPTDVYFEDVVNTNRPVIIFKGERAFVKERNAYGLTVDSADELTAFLEAREGGRAKPASNAIGLANILNPTLLNYTNALHETLDTWRPPAEITLYQIAGWGIETIVGIEFYDAPSINVLTALKPVPAYRPLFIEDGDGVVPVPSALMLSTDAENVKRYWVNLREFKKNNDDRDHGNILEIAELRGVIENIVSNSFTGLLPEFMSSSQPSLESVNKKLRFFLHSPLTLGIYDEFGNYTGITEDGDITKNIPNTEYGEFGDVQYLSVPQGAEYRLVLNGLDVGIFSLDIQEIEGGEVVRETTIANVPTGVHTVASLTIGDGIRTVSALSVDEDGDGTTDIMLQAKIGETLIYEKPVLIEKSDSEVVKPATSSGGGPIWNTPVGIVAGTSTAVSVKTQELIDVSSTTAHKQSGQIILTQKTIAMLPSAKSKIADSYTLFSKGFSPHSEHQNLFQFIQPMYTGIKSLWSKFTQTFSKPL